MIGLIAMALTATTTPTPLEPSGKWNVEYRDDMCLASRSFGPASANVTFALKPGVAIGSGSRNFFLLTPKTDSGVRRGRATITSLPSGLQRKVDYVSWIPKRDKLRGYDFEADAVFMESLGDATSLTIVAGKDRFSLLTGKLRALTAALNTCNEDLYRSWGLDPGATAQPLKGANPASWFPQDAYPSAAKANGEQGRSAIIVSVSADGKPTACRTASKATLTLDTATCQLAMRNGQFEPAPGKSDRYAVFAVRWELWGY